MLQPSAFVAPSPRGRYLFWAAPDNSICMPCMRMHAYAFICMNNIICTCMSTSTYACMAHACRHMHARYACTYIRMHGMRPFMHA